MASAIGLLCGLIIAADLASLSTNIAYLKYNLNLTDFNPYRKLLETETTRQIRSENGVVNMLEAAMIINRVPRTLPQYYANRRAARRGSLAYKSSNHFKPNQHKKPGQNGNRLAVENSKPRISIGMFRMS